MKQTKTQIKYEKRSEQENQFFFGFFFFVCFNAVNIIAPTKTSFYTANLAKSIESNGNDK